MMSKACFQFLCSLLSISAGFGPLSDGLAAQSPGTAVPVSIKDTAKNAVRHLTADLPAPSPKMDRRGDSLYIVMLERVNNQLALATNPWSLMVAGLGVLFTIGAIVAGWFLYRQGTEFREQRDKTLGDARSVVVAAVVEMKAQVAALIEQMRSEGDQLHLQLTQRIDDVATRADRATGDVKKEAEKELKNLKDIRASVEKQQQRLQSAAGSGSASTQYTAGSMKQGIPRPSTVFLNTPIMAGTDILGRSQKCNSCGKSFALPGLASTVYVGPGMAIECPYCGTVQPAKA